LALIRTLAAGFAIFAIIAALILANIITDLPSPVGHLGRSMPPSTLIYDRHGRLLYEIMEPDGGKQRPVSLHNIPIHLQQATVATEDVSFYDNAGVDLVAIVRAIWINLRGGEILSGGSTITQQVARNLLLSPQERSQRTLSRKLREAILAYQLSRTLSKEAILQLYLNTVYYGNLSYGVEAASHTYFGKPVGDLDLAECAMLAGMPQAPALHDPLTDPQQAKRRQRTVLDLMVKAGYVTADQAQAAADEPLAYASSPYPIRAPHFVMYVWELLLGWLGEQELKGGGLRVYTTLDLDLQDLALQVARRHLAQLSFPHDGQPAHNVHNTSVVAIDPRSGDILAMLGSPDYFDASIDGAVNVSLMPRQPGSAIKPLTYAAAFSQDCTPATMLLDIPSSFTTRRGESYTPVNYDHTYHGPVLLREALGSSLNVVAVRVLQHIGVEELVSLSHKLGITTLQDPDQCDLALTLGGGEVRLLELTGAYAALANGGIRVIPRAVLRVERQNGDTCEPYAPPAVRVLEDYVAFWVTDVLADNSARIPSFGESSALALSRPAAVKTGTTTDWRDNWTVGYTPQLAVGVWVGNADNSPMVEVSGISGAAPIWNEFMEQALKGQPEVSFSAPSNMLQVEVCADSGLLPGPHCPHKSLEWFVRGREPHQVCTMHRLLRLDSRTGELALPDTASQYVAEHRAMVLPPEAAQWARQNQETASICLIVERQEVEGTPYSSSTPGLSLTSPGPDSVFRISADIPAELQCIEIEAQTLGIPGTAKVHFYVDGQMVGSVSAAPYALKWQLQTGQHRLEAMASDGSGDRWTSKPVLITVLQ